MALTRCPHRHDFPCDGRGVRHRVFFELDSFWGINIGEIREKFIMNYIFLVFSITMWYSRDCQTTQYKLKDFTCIGRVFCFLAKMHAPLRHTRYM